MSKVNNLTGLRFNRLTVIEQAESTTTGRSRWLCKCDCGSEKIITGTVLLSGHTKSCGCLRVENLRSIEHRREMANRARIANTKHFGCWYCGSDKHYAKGYCRNCYEKAKRGTLE